MGKTLFVIELEEPKQRKKHAPPAKKHRNVKLYSRKQKHKGLRETAPGQTGGFFYRQQRKWMATPHTRAVFLLFLAKIYVALAAHGTDALAAVRPWPQFAAQAAYQHIQAAVAGVGQVPKEFFI